MADSLREFRRLNLNRLLGLNTEFRELRRSRFPVISLGRAVA
jgi:hypothetical protein